MYSLLNTFLNDLYFICFNSVSISMPVYVSLCFKESVPRDVWPCENPPEMAVMPEQTSSSSAWILSSDRVKG